MRITIARKLLVNNLFACSVMLVIAAITAFYSTQIRRHAEQAHAESAKYAMLAKDMQFHAVQVQQWLTDISATRAAEGFDDGFKMADEHAQEFLGMLKSFADFYTSKGLDERTRKVEALGSSFNDYYAIGKRMASAYIESGPEVGNEMMDEFDPAADLVNATLDEFVAYHHSQLEDTLGTVVSEAATCQWFAILCGIGGVAILLVLGWVITKSIIQPLNSTILALSNISHGNGDLTKRLDESRSDELGELAVQFNQFATTVQQMVQATAYQANSLVQVSGELTEVSRGNVRETTELQDKSTSMAAATRQLTSTMEATGSCTNDLTATAQSLAAAVTQLTNSISEVARSAERAAGVADETSKLAASSNSSIGQLDEAANEIGKVVDVIQEIAEQTNLLALNATIEAARAGEAGKGFAVVATEVKELAKQTAMATDDIRSRIVRIQSCSSQVIDSMNSITKSITNVNSESRTIAAAVEEQSISAKQISQNVEQSALAAETVAANVKESSHVLSNLIVDVTEVDSGVKRIASTAIGTQGSTGRLNSVSDVLDSLVRNYKFNEDSARDQGTDSNLAV